MYKLCLLVYHLLYSNFSVEFYTRLADGRGYMGSFYRPSQHHKNITQPGASWIAFTVHNFKSSVANVKKSCHLPMLSAINPFAANLHLILTTSQLPLLRQYLKTWQQTIHFSREVSFSHVCSTCLIAEVKRQWATLVLGWVTV